VPGLFAVSAPAEVRSQAPADKTPRVSHKLSLIWNEITSVGCGDKRGRSNAT
jgi:hypothetical protein